MADPVVTKTRPITRADLAKFLPNHQAIKTFENLTEDVGETLPDAVGVAVDTAEAAQLTADAAQIAAGEAQTAADAAQLAADGAQSSADAAQVDASTALTQLTTFSAIPIIVLTASGGLANERVLTNGAGINFVDAGPGLALTVSIAANVTLEDSLGGAVVQVSDNGAASELGLFGATPITRPTTAHAAGAFVANAGTAVNDASTFEGYTIRQIARALKDIGLLS